LSTPLRRNDFARRARGLVTVNALVVAALGLGLASNVLIAALFGLSDRVDAFFAAIVLPNLFMALCIDYLGKNFLPVLASAKAVGESCASSVTSSIVTMVAVLAAAVAIVLAAFSAPLFRLLLPGFDAEALELVGHYFAIMAPAIVLMAVNTFHEYVWQYEERYTYVSLSHAALPAANLAGLVLLAPWLGAYCLPVAYLVGHAAVFVLLLRGLPYRYRPQIHLRLGFERRVFTNSAIVMSTGLIARSKSIFLNWLASSLGSGAITAVALASKLTEPLERSAFTGVRMLMFSHTVRLAVERDRRSIGALYSMGLRAAFLVLAPLLAWIALNSGALVEVLYLRGQFTPDMAAVVAGVLLALVPSVLFLGVNQLLSNAFYAMDRVKVPAIVMPCGTLVYVAAAVPLSGWLGTQGLGVATTVAAMTVFAVLLIAIARHVPEVGLLRTAGKLALYVALAGTAMLGAVAVLSRFPSSGLAAAAVTLPLGTAAYAAALFLVRDRTFRQLLGLARAYVAGGLALSTGRSSKAPPAPKSD
jgi:putative peptidoglycan lipid II flippase